MKDFPTLRFIIPHGGGAVPYHWGRYRGLADMLKHPPLPEHVMKNIYFDTCVYHQPGIDLLFRVIDIKNILFGSEMVGAVRGIDPETGFFFDDTKRYVAGGYLISNQMQAAVAASLASNWLVGLPPEYLGEYVPRVRAVTAAEVQAMAAKYFAPERQTIVVVGDGEAVGGQLAEWGAFETVD